MPNYVPVDPPESLSEGSLRAWLSEELRRISSGFEELYNAQWSPLDYTNATNGAAPWAGNDYYGVPGCRKVGDIVLLRGLVSFTSAATQTVIGDVGEQYIPHKSHIMAAVHYNGDVMPVWIQGRDDSNPGRISVNPTGTGTYVSLGGLIYPLS